MTERQYKDLADKNEWPFFPNPVSLFNTHVPYFPPENFTIVTGNSSSGKSSFTKWMLFQFIEFAIKENKHLLILFLLLEETVEQFRYSLKSYLIFKNYGLELTMADMMSVSMIDGKRRILTNQELKVCEDIEPEVEQYMSYFKLNSPKSKNPFGLYKWVREAARENGNFYYEGKLLSAAELKTSDKYDAYVQNPNSTMFLVVDNCNNLTSENQMTEKQTIRKFVGEYVNQYITKYFKIHTFILQQQGKQTMDLDHIQAGYIYPTLGSLSVDKDTGNDARIVLGITDVFENEKMYKWPPSTKTYDRVMWADNSRVLNIPKNTLFGSRLTTTDKMIFMGFKGKCCTFYKV